MECKQSSPVNRKPSLPVSCKQSLPCRYKQSLPWICNTSQVDFGVLSNVLPLSRNTSLPESPTQDT